MRAACVAVMTAVVVSVGILAAAQERPVRLKEGPGRDKVEAHCSACHSLDYVVMNSPFLNASGWDAEVAKMINAFGAPIEPADAMIIANYLKKHYGTPLAAAAKERPVHLVQGPGLDKVEAHCGACHSLDYVVMNSPFLDARGWDAEVAKMINAFGAPIEPADSRVIADYLNKNYGPRIEARLPGIVSPPLEKEKRIPERSSPNSEVAHGKYDKKRAATARVVAIPRPLNHTPVKPTALENRETCAAESCAGHVFGVFF
jgi:hypothetical protein